MNMTAESLNLHRLMRECILCNKRNNNSSNNNKNPILKRKNAKYGQQANYTFPCCWTAMNIYKFCRVPYGILSSRQWKRLRQQQQQQQWQCQNETKKKKINSPNIKLEWYPAQPWIIAQKPNWWLIECDNLIMFISIPNYWHSNKHEKFQIHFQNAK